MTEPHPRPARRTVLTNLAGAGVVVPVLAACGSDSSSTGGSGAADGSSSPGSSGDGTIASTTEIPVGGGKIFPEQKVVVTQPTEGEFKAFSAVCTHQGCLVNRIADEAIDCPCHGSRYSIEDGSVLGGPAPAPLPAEKVRVQGDDVVLG